MINFGQRCYDPWDQFYFSTNPTRANNPGAVIADPALLPAYTCAGSSPESFVDPSGSNYVETIFST